MKKFFLVFVVLVCVYSVNIYSQISQDGIPWSFNTKVSTLISSNIQYQTMPAVDVTFLKNEDAITDFDKEVPWRFGKNIPVNYDLYNSGKWDLLPNGDRIWRIGIFSSGALTLNLGFDKYVLPEGAKLFIYSTDKSHILGAFTAYNNQVDEQFATTLIESDAIIIEYYEPANVSFNGKLNLTRVTHGYRNIFNYMEKNLGDAGSCQKNVVCPEGTGWENQIRSVCMLVVGGNGFCTGSLINNTAQNGTPYVLTAEHCTTADDFPQWVFWYNWQSATCANPGSSPAHDEVVTSGSELKARDTGSDFCLVQMNQAPPFSFNPYYSGWSKLNTPATSSMAIHHPSGDIKKVSPADTTVSVFYDGVDCWRADWTTDACTEQGSSGSPLFDQNRRIVGQLLGGPSFCGASPASMRDYYGKFSTSWTGGGSDSTRLSNWLDPLGTALDTLDGYDPFIPTVNLDAKVNSIIVPAYYYCAIQNISPIIEIENIGIDTLTSLVVKYYIDTDTIVTNWTGNLASYSTAQITFNPIILTTGNHTIYASISSPNGGTDENTVNDTLSKLYTVTEISGDTVPFSEAFENPIFPPTSWSISNPDNTTTWERNTSATGNDSSTAAAYIDCFNYGAQGELDDIISPTISLTGLMSAKLTFNVAYRRFDATFSERLKVFISTDCGTTFDAAPVYNKYGTALATGTDMGSAFTPATASDWRNDTVDLTPYTEKNIVIKFQCENGYGNNVYIDDINVTGVSATPPLANFSVNDSTICANSLIQFTDNSLYQPTSWEWAFPGASPGSSNLQNPTDISYSSNGSYDVTLIVTNAYGSDTMTKTAYIIVGTSSLPIAEDFESGIFPAYDWSVINPDGNITWVERASTTGSGGNPTTVAYINHYSYSVNIGTVDELISPNISLSGVIEPLLTFDVAYARYDSINNDRLRILASFDCDETFPVELYNKSGKNAEGNTLPTVPDNSADWVPSSGSDWRNDTVDLSSYINSDVTLKFESTNGWGNNLFIDNINISDIVPSLAVVVTSQTNAWCFGGNNGTVDITASGGLSPYSYDWGGGVTSEDRTGLTAGNYTVTVTGANSSTATTSATITEPVALILTTSSTNSSCGLSNGTATVTPSGGTSPYAYQWDANAGDLTTQTSINLSADIYDVTVTDINGCTVIATANVSDDLAPAVSISSRINVSCNGDSNGQVIFTASGGTAPYTYTPDDTLINLTAENYWITVTDANNCVATSSAIITEPAVLTANVSSQINVSCNGDNNGQAIFTASGGTSPYIYNSDDTLMNLTAGTYNVTVTDANSCTATTSATITQPAAALTVSLSSQTSVSCNGDNNGQAIFTASGGTSPYTYNPVDTLSNLTAGTYTVTVTDANNCTATMGATITEPVALTLTTSSTNSSCGLSDGTATVTPSGGTSPYAYQWDAGTGDQTTQTAINLSAGTYNVTVTDDNGCTATTTTNVNNNGSITVSISSQTNVSCNGDNNGQVIFTASGGTAPYTYTPDDTLINLTAENYWITVTDANSCVATSSAIITEPAVLTANVSSQINVSCNGGSDGQAIFTTSGGTSPYTYNPVDTLSNLTAGTYTVTVTDANNCTATTDATITEPVALTLTTSSTNSSCGLSDGTATVTPSGGTSPYSYLWDDPSTQTTITATSLSAGIYNVSVNDANGCPQVTASTSITEPTLSFTDSFAPVNWTFSTDDDGSVDTTGAPCSIELTGVDGGIAGNTDYTITLSGCGTSVLSFDWDYASVDIPGYDSSGYLVNGFFTVVSTATGESGTVGPISVNSGDVIGFRIFSNDGEYGPGVLTVTNFNAITACVSSTDITCFGNNDGSATALPSGGTPPYAYQWDGPGSQTTITATGLSAGTYNVTVTDAATATATSSVTISEPAILTTSVSSQINLSCNGDNNGQAIFTAADGTSPYTYNPVDTLSDLTAGTYIVTVTDANNCTATSSAIITEPTVLTASLSSQTNLSCNGDNNGQAIFTASDGTSPYTFNPVDTLSDLTAGTYNVTVTDANSCTATASATITEPALIITSTAAQICDGDSIYLQNTYQEIAGIYYDTLTAANTCDSIIETTLTINPVYPYTESAAICNGETYNWHSNNYSVTGIYYDSLTTVASCDSVYELVLNVNPQLIATATSIEDNGTCNGTATVVVTGGTLPYNYLWDDTLNQTTETATDLCYGTYIVFVTDSIGCSDTAFVYIGLVSVNEVAMGNDIAIYPIPTTGIVNIITTGNFSIRIYDLMGKIVFRSSSASDKTSVDLSELSEGNYMIVININDSMFTKMITLKK